MNTLVFALIAVPFIIAMMAVGGSARDYIRVQTEPQNGAEYHGSVTASASFEPEV